MLESCKFVDGQCAYCGFVCDLKNVHVPCNASDGIKNAVLLNAKNIAEHRKKATPVKQKTVGLGDLVKAGLSAIGITEQRVSKVLGKPCGCGKRAEKLNELGRKFGIG